MPRTCEFDALLLLHVDQLDGLFWKVWVTVESNGEEAVKQVVDYLKKMPQVSHIEDH